MTVLRFGGISTQQNIIASSSMASRAASMRLRGWALSARMGSCGGPIYVGRRAQVRNPGYIRAAGRLVIEDLAEVQGLSTHGVTFGAEVSIGRGAMIRPTSYYGGDVGWGLVMGDRSSIGAGSFIGCSGRVEIGSDVMFGPGGRVFSENHVFVDTKSTIKSQGVERTSTIIGDDCWFGSGTTITAGVRIGSGVVAAAGSVIIADVPDRVVVAGVPARIVKQRQ